MPEWPRRCPGRGIAGVHLYFALLLVTTGYYRLLQVTLGYYRLLLVTIGYYRLLQVTTGYYKMALKVFKN